MKNHNWVLLAFLPVWLGVGSAEGPGSGIENDSGPAPANNICTIRNTAFSPGEEIIYKVYYNLNFIWIPAGEVVFRVNEIGNEYHYTAQGRTYPSYEWFFKVRDQYDSYVDKQSLLPSLSIRDIREGGYTLYEKNVFDQKGQKAYCTRGRSREKIKEERVFEVESCMHDILSIIYFSRNINFQQMQKGDKLPIKIFMDKETWPLQVVYKGKEADKKIKGQGKFNTILFSPEVIEGSVFRKGTEMNVWVTDDENKIPLLIESPVSVGSVKAVLKEYKGLRYPMRAAAE